MINLSTMCRFIAAVDESLSGLFCALDPNRFWVCIVNERDVKKMLDVPENVRNKVLVVFGRPKWWIKLT